MQQRRHCWLHTPERWWSWGGSQHASASLYSQSEGRGGDEAPTALHKKFHTLFYIKRKQSEKAHVCWVPHKPIRKFNMLEPCSCSDRDRKRVVARTSRTISTSPGTVRYWQRWRNTTNKYCERKKLQVPPPSSSV